MTPRRLLFLLGGSEAADAVAGGFLSAAGGCGCRIVALGQSREGWKMHKSEYVQPWGRQGVSQYCTILLDEEGVSILDAASARLSEATGILVCGGHTPAYHQLYSTEPIRGVARKEGAIAGYFESC